MGAVRLVWLAVGLIFSSSSFEFKTQPFEFVPCDCPCTYLMVDQKASLRGCLPRMFSCMVQQRQAWSLVHRECRHKAPLRGALDAGRQV